MTDWKTIVDQHGQLVWATAWRLLGNSLAEIESPNSAITRVRLSTNSRQFTFQLTVTNDKRLFTSDTAAVTYTGP